MKLIKQKFLNIPATASKMANFVTSTKSVWKRTKICYLRISKIWWYDKFAFSGFIYSLVIENDVGRNNKRRNWQLIWYLIRKPVTTLTFFAMHECLEKKRFLKFNVYVIRHYCGVFFVVDIKQVFSQFSMDQPFFQIQQERLNNLYWRISIVFVVNF